uniref:Uncharacterized protein n=1 Tax=Rhizophora mucronata TaxID=61149 RepID=A0A2P2KSY6_RHIMU
MRTFFLLHPCLAIVNLSFQMKNIEPLRKITEITLIEKLVYCLMKRKLC